jgi:Domain of unknown function (DUF4277)
MQAQKFQLQALRVGALPILNRFIERMALEEELSLALKNAGYADVMLALLKNILIERNALYAIEEWAGLFDAGLASQGKINDDKLARVLDRLFAAVFALICSSLVPAAADRFPAMPALLHSSVRSFGAASTRDRIDNCPDMPAMPSAALEKPLSER